MRVVAVASGEGRQASSMCPDSAEVLLAEDVPELRRLWVISEQFELERTRLLGKTWDEPPDALASLLAGLAIGMLSIGECDFALCYAGLALRTGPTAHDTYCCSAAEVMFSPKVFRAGSEFALIEEIGEALMGISPHPVLECRTSAGNTDVDLPRTNAIVERD